MSRSRKLRKDCVYDIVLDSVAEKQLSKLPRNIQSRVITKLEVSRIHPYRFFEKLSGRSEYKLRVGDYRIIADINDKEIIILLLYVAHRRTVYERFK